MVQLIEAEHCCVVEVGTTSTKRVDAGLSIATCQRLERGGDLEPSAPRRAGDPTVGQCAGMSPSGAGVFLTGQEDLV